MYGGRGRGQDPRPVQRQRDLLRDRQHLPPPGGSSGGGGAGRIDGPRPLARLAVRRNDREKHRQSFHRHRRLPRQSGRRRRPGRRRMRSRSPATSPRSGQRQLMRRESQKERKRRGGPMGGKRGKALAPAGGG